MEEIFAVVILIVLIGCSVIGVVFYNTNPVTVKSNIAFECLKQKLDKEYCTTLMDKVDAK